MYLASSPLVVKRKKTIEPKFNLEGISPEKPHQEPLKSTLYKQSIGPHVLFVSVFRTDDLKDRASDNRELQKPTALQMQL